MKKNREHVVPLSDAAIALLRRMQVERVFRREGDNHAFVFPGGRGETQSAAIPMSNQSLWLFVQRMVGGEVEATVHGFRSAFKVWADQNGIADNLSERCLAHVIGDATHQAYGRDELVEPRRPVMEAWAQFLAAANVVPFPSQAA
jgi:integrase